jgi:hypothetical protein
MASTLLLLAALSALIMIPGGVGQSLTTVVTTVTTPVVIVDTVNSTVGTTQAQSTAFTTEAYSTPFAIEPTQGVYGCVYQTLPFAASLGEAISIDVKSTVPISIYIMTGNDYRAWLNGKSCSATSSALYDRQQVSIALIDMIAPSTGDYDLVFLNFSSSSSASVSLGFQGVSQAITTMSVPVVSGFSVTETYTATGNLTSVRTVNDAFTMIQQYGLAPGIVAVVVLVVALFAFRRRSKQRRVKAVTVVPEVKAPVSGSFCGNCGKPIPPNSKFCNYCGEPAEEKT